MGPVGEYGVVGRFRVLGELGRGGMGRVLLASAPDGRLVAVKLVHAHFLADEGFRERFRREVVASRRVSGAYTAAVVGADTEAEVPWLASVFVQGPSLRDVITKAGGLPADAVLRLAAGLATALGEIHSVGLVHRDLKPANVLLADDGPRVIDFGIARALDNSTFTHEGTVIGSPLYMSPEQAEGGPVTPASDVFSLGSLLVIAATGHDAFAGPTELAIRRAVCHANPDLSGLTEGLRRIVSWCLAKDPGGRPSPRLLVDAIGDLEPTLRPWPPEVYDMTAAQAADIANRVTHPTEDTTFVQTTPRTTTLLQTTWPDPPKGQDDHVATKVDDDDPAVDDRGEGPGWFVETYRSVRDTGLMLAGLVAGAVVAGRVVTAGHPVRVTTPGYFGALVGLGLAVVLVLVMYGITGLWARVAYSLFGVLPLAGLVVEIVDAPVTVLGVGGGGIAMAAIVGLVLAGALVVGGVAAIRQRRYALATIGVVVGLAAGYATCAAAYLGLVGVTVGAVTVEFGTVFGAVVGAALGVRLVRWIRTGP